MSQQKQCPECNSFKVKTSKDQAATLIITGVLLSIIIIGIPVLLYGIVLAVLPTSYTCKACNYKWK